MTKVRVVMREFGKSYWYVIQQRDLLLWWQWVDASWIDSHGVTRDAVFGTLEEAEKNLKHFDGTKYKDTVMIEK